MDSIFINGEIRFLSAFEAEFNPNEIFSLDQFYDVKLDLRIYIVSGEIHWR